MIGAPPHQPSDQERGDHRGGEPDHPHRAASARVLLVVARAQAGLERVLGAFERCGVAAEGIERDAEAGLDRLQRPLELDPQLGWRVAAYDGGEHRARRVLDQHLELADLEHVERVAGLAAEGVAHEVADGGEHPGDHVGILRLGVGRHHVAQQQARFLVDEEELLDAVDQAVEQDDLGERLAAAPRFEAPAQTLDREAGLDRAVGRLQHAAHGRDDRLANGRAHDREESVGDALRVFAHRAAHGARHRVLQRGVEGIGVARAAGRDGAGDHRADFVGGDGAIVEALLDALEAGALGGKEEPAELFDLGLLRGADRKGRGVAAGIHPRTRRLSRLREARARP